MQQSKQAGTVARLLVGLLGLTAVGLGVAGCFLCPGLIGYVAAALFVPCGGWVLFVALRGRRSDLQQFAPASVGSAAAGEAIAQVAEGIVDHV